MLYLFLADGFEETEALVPLDCIRRAGLKILTVGVGKERITGSHGIEVSADITADYVDVSECDGILLPGGMPGTENLYASEVVKNVISFCSENKKLIASICAAPSIPGRMGLLSGIRAVCFPGFEEKMPGHIPSDRPVERDGCFITAKGAGCVFPFSSEIISYLIDENAADDVLRKMQYALL